MEVPTVGNSSGEVPNKQAVIHVRTATRPDETFRLLNLREIEREFGLYELQVYAAARRKLIHPVVAPGSKRLLYPVWEIETLAELVRSGKFTTPEWPEGYPDRREFGEEYERWLAEAADEPPLTSIASAEASA